MKKISEEKSIVTGIRLTQNDANLLRQLAGPRGASKLIRSLIRAEAARRMTQVEGKITNG